MKKRTFVLCLLSLLLFSSSAYALDSLQRKRLLESGKIGTVKNRLDSRQRSGHTKDLGLNSIKVGEIPIVAWYGLLREHISLRNFIDMRKAGFTHHISYIDSDREIAKSFAYAEQAGIKQFLFLDMKFVNTESMIRRVRQYKDHPALAGYFIYDEPDYEQLYQVKEWADKIYQEDPQADIYLNLYPNLGNPSYKKYVDRCIKLFPRIKQLSFGHYPILSNHIRSPLRMIRPQWYKNLETIANSTQKASLPFWAFVMSSAHTIPGGLSRNEFYPIPTLADLRLQAYSDLAYGAKGIQHFTYYANSEMDLYYDAPFYNGRLTPTYQVVSTLNKEIQALSEIFMSSQVESVYHLGDVPRGAKKLKQKKLPKPFRKVYINGSEEGILVSTLKSPNKNYLLIQNKDLKTTLTLGVEMSMQGAAWQIDKSSKREARIEENFVSYQISPGDIVLFSYIE